MTEEQIKTMVDRFLAWKLPENFNPDAGISFVKDYNVFTAHPRKHEPSGTNLFDATQAAAMVRHMVDGLSLTSAQSDGFEPSDFSEVASLIRSGKDTTRFSGLRDNDKVILAALDRAAVPTA